MGSDSIYSMVGLIQEGKRAGLCKRKVAAKMNYWAGLLTRHIFLLIPGEADWKSKPALVYQCRFSMTVVARLFATPHYDLTRAPVPSGMPATFCLAF